MKKEITEYETAEETHTKIQCASCDETWDHRGIRGKKGVTTVVLDAGIARSRYNGWSGRDFDRTLFGDDRYQITGEAIEDYCAACWDAQFSEGPAVEVEEPEYYVEEETREEYYCDFCGDHMGEEPDHEVSVNPRIRNIPRRPAGRYNMQKDRSPTVLTRELEDPVSHEFSRDDLEAERDELLDTCEDCATDIFDLEEPTTSRGFFGTLIGAMVNMFSAILDILLLRGF